MGTYWSSLFVVAVAWGLGRLTAVTVTLILASFTDVPPFTGAGSGVVPLVCVGIGLVVSVAVLSCLYVRRMRDAGFPTWLVLLPNLPWLCLAYYPVGPRLTTSQEDVALACLLIGAPLCWLVAAVMASMPTRAKDARTSA